MTSELWLPIKDFDMYEISNEGRVRSYWNNRHNKKDVATIIKPTVSKLGYSYVDLSSKDRNKSRFYIHRLVALHFLTNDNNLDFVDHIDRNPKNNKVENLRFATHSMNMRNCRLSKNNTSGEPNISWSKYDESWVIRFLIDGKYITRKRKSFEEAIKIRNEILCTFK